MFAKVHESVTLSKKSGIPNVTPQLNLVIREKNGVEISGSISISQNLLNTSCKTSYIFSGGLYSAFATDITVSS
jgi:hypothetical protein